MCAVNSCSCGVFNVLEHDIQQTRYFMRFFILLFYLTCVSVQLNFCQSKPRVFEREKTSWQQKRTMWLQSRAVGTCRIFCSQDTSSLLGIRACWHWALKWGLQTQGIGNPSANSTLNQSMCKTDTLTMFTRELVHLSGHHLWCHWLCECPSSQYFLFLFLFSNLYNCPCAGK